MLSFCSINVSYSFLVAYSAVRSLSVMHFTVAALYCPPS